MRLALLQIVAGVKYIMEVEIARTTCTKPATDVLHCAFHQEPQMAKVGSRAQPADRHRSLFAVPSHWLTSYGWLWSVFPVCLSHHHQCLYT